MKQIFSLIFGLFIAQGAMAQTVNLNWVVDGQTYATTTCQTGDDIILPTPPTKYGYTFRGWEAYTFLEYIETNGSQWINTGIPVNHLNAETVTIETTFQMLTGSDVDFFGTTSNSTATIIYNIAGNSGSKYVRWGTTASRNISATLYIPDALHKVTLTGLNTLQIYIDDVLIATNTISNAAMLNDTPLLIGRGRNTGAASRWANFKISNGPTVVFNGIAARRNSDSAIGMFDTISGTFFANSGTGTFVAGPEL